MKVYVDFNELDAEDLPSSISNNYNLQVRSINSGSDYKNVKLINLADYTKQVRKKVCEEIKEKCERTYTISPSTNKPKKEVLIILAEDLDQIQGENNVKD